MHVWIHGRHDSHPPHTTAAAAANNVHEYKTKENMPLYTGTIQLSGIIYVHKSTPPEGTFGMFHRVKTHTRRGGGARRRSAWNCCKLKKRLLGKTNM